MKKIVLVLLLSLLPWPWAFAQGLPSFYPSGHENMGVVNRIDLAEQRITIQDRVYVLTGVVKVHLPRLLEAALTDISVGDQVGFTTERVSSRVEKVTEIWVYPDGTRPTLPLPPR